MKPRRVVLNGTSRLDEVVERVLKTRLREAHELNCGLARRDKQGLHDFRIACKRLRYALERFEDLDPSLQSAAERLALLQDALGEAHDRDVLLAILPPQMAATQRRFQSERESSVDRSVALWAEAYTMMEAVDSHPI